jgi:hypothetical protein
MPQPVHQTGANRSPLVQITGAPGDFARAGVMMGASGILGAVSDIAEDDQSVNPHPACDAV